MGFDKENPLSIKTALKNDLEKHVYKSKCFQNEEIRLNSYRKKIYQGQRTIQEGYEAIKKLKKIPDERLYKEPEPIVPYPHISK